MTDAKIATKRTGWNTAVLTFVVFIMEQLTARDIDVDNPALIVIVPTVVTVFYRASLEAAAKWPALGRILFGGEPSPTYDD